MSRRALLIIGAVFTACVGLGLIGGLVYAKAHKPKAAVVHQVDLLADHANPSIVPVKLGESVQFNTKDGLKHNIDQGLGETNSHNHDAGGHDHTVGGLSSGDFKSGEAWRAQFKKVGTYYFHDHFQPDIRITIVVYGK